MKTRYPLYSLLAVLLLVASVVLAAGAVGESRAAGNYVKIGSDFTGDPQARQRVSGSLLSTDKHLPQGLVAIVWTNGVITHSAPVNSATGRFQIILSGPGEATDTSGVYELGIIGPSDIPMSPPIPFDTKAGFAEANTLLALGDDTMAGWQATAYFVSIGDTWSSISTAHCGTPAHGATNRLVNRNLPLVLNQLVWVVCPAV